MIAGMQAKPCPAGTTGPCIGPRPSPHGNEPYSPLALYGFFHSGRTLPRRQARASLAT